jgi:hypothetical protein
VSKHFRSYKWPRERAGRNNLSLHRFPTRGVDVLARSSIAALARSSIRRGCCSDGRPSSAWPMATRSERDPSGQSRLGNTSKANPSSRALQ